MFVECSPPTLVSISSSQFPLSSKLCSMSVHRSVRKLEFYRISISHSRWVGGPLFFVHRIESTPPTLASKDINSSPSPLTAKHWSMGVHPSIQELEFYRIISRLTPISYTRAIVGRAVVCCPSNANPQLWCLSAPPHHLCPLNIVPMGAHRSVQESKFLPNNQQAQVHVTQ